MAEQAEKNLLDIDKFNLDEENANHPKLFDKWAKKREDAWALHRKLKAQIKVLCAEIYLDVRKNPEAYGFDKKPSEDTVNSLVLIDSRRIELERQMLEAEHQAEIYAAFTFSLRDKRDSLADLAKLALAGLYSYISVDREAQNQAQTKQRSELAKRTAIPKNRD